MSPYPAPVSVCGFVALLPGGAQTHFVRSCSGASVPAPLQEGGRVNRHGTNTVSANNANRVRWSVNKAKHTMNSQALNKRPMVRHCAKDTGTLRTEIGTMATELRELLTEPALASLTHYITLPILENWNILVTMQSLWTPYSENQNQVKPLFQI